MVQPSGRWVLKAGSTWIIFQISSPTYIFKRPKNLPRNSVMPRVIQWFFNRNLGQNVLGKNLVFNYPASKLSIWGISWKEDAREARERSRECGGPLAARFARPNRRACFEFKCFLSCVKLKNHKEVPHPIVPRPNLIQCSLTKMPLPEEPWREVYHIARG